MSRKSARIPFAEWLGDLTRGSKYPITRPVYSIEQWASVKHSPEYPESSAYRSRNGDLEEHIDGNLAALGRSTMRVSAPQVKKMKGHR